MSTTPARTEERCRSCHFGFYMIGKSPGLCPKCGSCTDPVAPPDPRIVDARVDLGEGDRVEVWRAVDHDLAGIYLTIANGGQPWTTTSFTHAQRHQAAQIARALLAWSEQDPQP